MESLGAEGGDCKTMIVLGSGGHTKEILNFVPCMPSTFSPRVYTSTHTDTLSLDKARQVERRRKKADSGKEEAKFLSVYRIREVGQSWLSVIFFSAPVALLHCALLLLRERPRLIICNGPGICVPIALLAVIFNKLWITNAKIVFVESICRVETLSMSGKFMIRLAHLFFVQWEELYEMCTVKYPRAEVRYMGRLT